MRQACTKEPSKGTIHACNWTGSKAFVNCKCLAILPPPLTIFIAASLDSIALGLVDFRSRLTFQLEGETQFRHQQPHGLVKKYVQ